MWVARPGGGSTHGEGEATLLPAVPFPWRGEGGAWWRGLGGGKGRLDGCVQCVCMEMGVTVSTPGRAGAFVCFLCAGSVEGPPVPG